MNKVLASKNAPAAIGPYSQGIQAGNMVFVSGQLPIDPATGALCEATVTEATTRALTNISNILAEAGCTMADVVKTTVLLKDIGDFAEMNAAYAAFFPANPPARACFQVGKLPKDAVLEIEAIACKQ